MHETWKDLAGGDGDDLDGDDVDVDGDDGDDGDDDAGEQLHKQPCMRHEKM